MISGSCKSYRKSAYTATRHLSKNKFKKELEAHRFKAHSFESRLSLKYTDDRQNMTGNGRLRILKDSIIWGSINFLGIPVVKFYITPNEIQYYNKINQTYYKGNFSLVEKTLGIRLNFNHLQNLLLGDLIMPLSKRNFQLDKKNKFYRLSPSNSYIKSAEISPFFKILTEKIKVSKKMPLEIRYLNYQSIKNENLPQDIEIKGQEKQIKLHYKNLSLGKKLHFPFEIPANYHRIKL